MKPKIYIHHDAYNIAGNHLAAVNEQHMSEKYPQSKLGYYTFYQYFIERNGKCVQTRPEMDPDVVYKPAHRNSISICLAGNFDKIDPHPAQIEALKILLNDLHERHGIHTLDIHEHRDYQATSCPGSRITAGYWRRIFIDAQLDGVRRLLALVALNVIEYMLKPYAKR